MEARRGGWVFAVVPAVAPLPRMISPFRESMKVSRDVVEPGRLNWRKSFWVGELFVPGAKVMLPSLKRSPPKITLRPATEIVASLPPAVPTLPADEIVPCSAVTLRVRPVPVKPCAKLMPSVVELSVEIND